MSPKAVATAEQGCSPEADPLRSEILETSRKFKSSWVELGALLVQVRDRESWSGWGFKSFETYCTKELRIKRLTAQKLTNSYAFLSKHEKGFRERVRSAAKEGHAFDPPAPPLEVVSLLADAEERGQLSAKDYNDLREEIWSRNPSDVGGLRELSSRFPSPPKSPPPAELRLRRLAQAARRMAVELGDCQRIPGEVVERARILAEELEELASKG